MTTEKIMQYVCVGQVMIHLMFLYSIEASKHGQSFIHSHASTTPLWFLSGE